MMADELNISKEIIVTSSLKIYRRRRRRRSVQSSSHTYSWTNRSKHAKALSRLARQSQFSSLNCTVSQGKNCPQREEVSGC
jgi:hypothetical protein